MPGQTRNLSDDGNMRRGHVPPFDDRRSSEAERTGKRSRAAGRRNNAFDVHGVDVNTLHGAASTPNVHSIHSASLSD